MAIIEHLVSAITMFVVYKLVIKFLGIELLGLWSILLVIVSLTGIGTSGFASSAIKFVAKYTAKIEYNKLISVIETTFITVFWISSIILFVISVIFYYFKFEMFTIDEFELIKEIYAYIILSYLIGSLSSVYLSSLDGLNLIYLRSLIGIISKLAFLISSFFLLEIHGLKGLALGLLIQNLITLIFSSFFLKSLIKGLNLLFIRFDKEIFKEIFNYGYKFQLISILQMLMDPLTKFLLKSYGGLASVGYFELIFKFLFHARQLIVVATNTVIPTVASLQEQINNSIKEKFNIIFSLNFIFSIIILTLTFSLLPIFIAFVNIEMDEQVSLYSSLIYFGLLFNLFSVAPFVFNLGLGRLNMNLLSISLMAILNLTLSLFFAFFYQGTGVIMGWMSSQIISNILLFLLFIRSQNISPRNIISKSDIFLVFTIIASLIALYIFNSKFNGFNLFITLLINVMIPLGLMSIPILKNKKYQFVKKYVRKKINI